MPINQETKGPDKPVRPEDLSTDEIDYVNPNRLEEGGLNIQPDYKTPSREEKPVQGLAG